MIDRKYRRQIVFNQDKIILVIKKTTFVEQNFWMFKIKMDIVK